MSKMILIAEDDKGVALTMKMVFDEYGYASCVVDSCAGVGRCLETCIPDLILLDHLGHDECKNVVSIANSAKKKYP